MDAADRQELELRFRAALARMARASERSDAAAVARAAAEADALLIAGMICDASEGEHPRDGTA